MLAEKGRCLTCVKPRDSSWTRCRCCSRMRCTKHFISTMCKSACECSCQLSSSCWSCSASAMHVRHTLSISCLCIVLRLNPQRLDAVSLINILGLLQLGAPIRLRLPVLCVSRCTYNICECVDYAMLEPMVQCHGSPHLCRSATRYYLAAKRDEILFGS